MGNFFAELRRRHIYRVGAGYVVVAWVLTQVVEAIAQIYAPPAWIPQAVVAVLAIGFPVALAVAWMIEGKAHEAVVAAVRSPATTIDYALFGAVALVTALIGYQQFAPANVAPVQQAGMDAARLAANSPGTAISVAVLPLTNLSSDPEQEYFSDGMTEEIGGALAKIPDLRVVARTSAFQFREQDRDIRTIGEALHATHFIEGSVRRDGNRVRISARLVRANDGLQIWSEDYDRQLTDVFAIQEDVAHAVATSLGMQLGLAPGERLIADRLDDQQIHELYLRARAQLRLRDVVTGFGLTLLEQVVARAPDFAPGWALLSQSLRVQSAGRDRADCIADCDSARQRAVDAAQKAIELDPELADGYAALAAMRSVQGEWAESFDLIKKALALDPDNPEVLHNYRTGLRRLGYLGEALRVSEHLTAVEPLVGIYTRLTGDIEMANGVPAGEQTLEKATLQESAGTGPVDVRRLSALAAARAQDGRLDEAADTLVMAVPQTRGEYDAAHAEAAIQILRAAAQKRTPPPFPEFNSELNFVYIYAGVPERMLEWAEQPGSQDTSFSRNWWPMPSAVRHTERFKTIVRNAGLVDFWKSNGWPDLCHPIGDDDFECD